MTNKFHDTPVAMPNVCYNSDPAHKTLADSYQEWAANTQQVYKAYSQGQEDSGDVMSKQAVITTAKLYSLGTSLKNGSSTSGLVMS
jgi:hypothetical protein